MSEFGSTPAPGWYADPWNQRPQRYWDGTQWTGHTNDPTGYPNQPSGYPMLQRVGPSVEDRDPAKLANVTKWTSWGVFFNVTTAIVLPIFFSTFFRSFSVAFTDPDAFQSNGPFQSGSFRIGFALQPLSLLAWISSASWMVFTYRATTLARALGRATPRDPALACASWIIPIVQFWWPLESLRALSTKPTTRTLCAWFWAGFFASSFIGIFAAFAAVLIPLWIAIFVGVAASGIAAFIGRKIMIDITTELTELARSQTAN